MSYRFTNRRRCALLAGIIGSALGCGTAHDLDDAGDEIGDAEGRVTAVVQSTTGASAMESPNGTKVLVGYGNQLYAVYAEAGAVKYTTSTDGVTWTTPVTLASPNASGPTVAVASDGTVGIAFVQSSVLKYRKKPLNGAWSVPVQITSDPASQYAEDASMVAYGNDMHIAWSGSPLVHYARFPASGVGVPLPATETLNPWVLCSTQTVGKPAIAVSRKGANDPTALVRVAYFEMLVNGGSCSLPSRFGPTVAERPDTVVTGFPWNNPVWSDTTWWSSPVNAGGTSMSLAAVPSTGDFYLAYSDHVNGIDKTELLYENAWNTTDAWRANQLAPRQTIVDVTAEIVDCDPVFRVADADFTLGSNGYGPTWYRTGQWLGAAPAAPTWHDGAPVTVNSNGRNAEALFFRKTFGVPSWSTRTIPTVYEQITGSTKSIAEETSTRSGPAAVKLCPAGRSLSCQIVVRFAGGGVADAEIFERNPRKNDGTGAAARVDAARDRRRRMLLQFDLSAVPPRAVIASAVVTLSGKVRRAATMKAYGIKEVWKEETVTWASFADGFGGEPAAIFPVDVHVDWDPISFDVTALAQSWVDRAAPNNGLVLEQDAASSTTFRTSEAREVAAQPQIDVCYYLQ